MQEFHGNMLGWESKLQQNEGKMSLKPLLSGFLSSSVKVTSLPQQH